MAYPFQIRHQYTRKAIFEIIGVPRDSRGGKWFIGSVQHGDDWFIFATVGDVARTGHDYANWWDGREFYWSGKTGSRIDNPTVRHMTSGEGAVYIFTRAGSRDPFTFNGFGTMVTYEDVIPVRIVWAVRDTSAGRSVVEIADGESLDDSSDVDGADRNDRLEVSDISEPPDRIPSTVNRIIRDTARSRRLKRHYGHRCQVCDIRLEIEPGRYYSEAHHIQPLGSQHRGLDREDNMLVLCPNHHALFDLGVPRFIDDDHVEIHGEVITLRLLHRLSPESIEYHNTVLALHRS